MKQKLIVIDPYETMMPQFSKDYIFPGDKIPNSDETSVPGPGTKKCSNNDGLVAMQIGIPIKVNQFTSMQTQTQLYIPQVNDVVIGRVISLQYNRWLLDIRSTKNAILKLDSLNLPGLLRQRTNAEETNMRLFLTENDLICVEMRHGCQAFTRNQLFGKLSHGIMLEVPSRLVTGTQHFVNINAASVILGKNGRIWISARRQNQQSAIFDHTQQVFNLGKEADAQIMQQIQQILIFIQTLVQQNSDIAFQQLFDEFQTRQKGSVWAV